MSIGNIGFSGLGSGIPVDDIIKATLQAESIPIKRLEADKKFAQEQISAYGQLSSRLDNLAGAMRNLRGADKFEVLSAQSSHSDALTATAQHDDGAVNGVYNVVVDRTARNDRWVSESLATDQVFSGSLQIAGQTLGPEAGESWSLDELRAAINDNEALKDQVSATVINEGSGTSRLVINSLKSGEAGKIALDTSGMDIQQSVSVDSSFAQSNVNIGGEDYTRVRSSGWMPAGSTFESGTFKVSSLSGSNLPYSGSFEVDVSGRTLQEAVNDLNAAFADPAGDGSAASMSDHLQAFIVSDNGQERIEIRSQLDEGTNTGVSNFQLGIEDARLQATAPLDGDSLTGNLDAQISIDGITATSSTDTFSDVITGVTINLKDDAQAGDTSTLRVSRDDATIKDRIDDFIKAYNDVIIHINEAKKGPLGSEGVLRSIEGQLRDTLYTPTGGDGNLDNTLARMGIGTIVETGWTQEEGGSSRNGTLEITDQARFNDVLENDFEKLAFIFGDSDTGYARRFERTARSLTDGIGGDQGLIQSRRKGLASQMERIDTRTESLNMRLEAMENRLYKQFNAVDSIIANLNSSGDFIAQQVSNLPGYTRPRK